MINKFTLLMLCVFTLPYSTQAMNNGFAEKSPFGFTAHSQALSLPAMDVISYCGELDAARQALAHNPLALHAASLKGDLKQVKVLVAVGASVNSKDTFGYTPLHRAAMKGYEDVVKFLVEHGAVVNSKDKSGKTPLSWAAIMGHEENVDCLIKHGAYVNTKSNFSETPFQEAVNALQENYTIVKSLACTSFFPLRPSRALARSSLQELCLIKLLMKLGTMSKECRTKSIIDLAHSLTVSDKTLSIFVDRVPLRLQRSFINTLRNIIAVQEQDAQVIQGAQKALNAILNAHGNRHLNKIRALLKTKSLLDATARDIASKKGYEKIVELFDRIEQATAFKIEQIEDCEQIDERLKKPIMRIIKSKLLMN